MKANWVREAEGYVLAELHVAPQDIDEVVERVREMHREFAVAQVKVAALNLVSQGRAKLDKDWQLMAPAEG
jgi:hypothetical protein